MHPIGCLLYLHPYGCIYMRRDVFHGIADPTRRQILARLTKQKLNLTTVADAFDISRQSVTKHVKILIECGLVTVEKQGRETYCKARPEKLTEVTRWMKQFSVFMAESYDRLDDYLKTLQKNKSDHHEHRKTKSRNKRK
jgi:DNA-binding transcriptional ArsR family regulator